MTSEEVEAIQQEIEAKGLKRTRLENSIAKMEERQMLFQRMQELSTPFKPQERLEMEALPKKLETARQQVRRLDDQIEALRNKLGLG